MPEHRQVSLSRLAVYHLWRRTPLLFQLLEPVPGGAYPGLIFAPTRAWATPVSSASTRSVRRRGLSQPRHTQREGKSEGELCSNPQAPVGLCTGPIPAIAALPSLSSWALIPFWLVFLTYRLM